MNETTRHADVVLPGPEPLEKSHYDLALYQLAVRNVANYSPPVFERDGPRRVGGVPAPRRECSPARGRTPTSKPLDDLVIATLVQREVGDPGSRVAGRDPAELIAALEPRRGPERVVDFMLRVGPYGDGFGAEPDGLTLDVLERNPHGVDLGPHRERIPEVLRTPSGQDRAGARGDRRRRRAAAAARSRASATAGWC